MLRETLGNDEIFRKSISKIVPLILNFCLYYIFWIAFSDLCLLDFFQISVYVKQHNFTFFKIPLPPERPRPFLTDVMVSLPLFFLNFLKNIYF